MLKNYYERKYLACYTCRIELRQGHLEAETGIGLGRIGRSENFQDGLYKLFFLSSMKAEFKVAVRQQLDEEN